jgi:2-phosphoglycerate kinase
VVKPIVLIGGSSGAGKTTLAGKLKADLGLDHFIGTGFIRAIVQSETTPEDDPELFSMTFQSPDPVAHIVLQARRLHRAVASCIDRARREGTSIVIEGTHLIPELYHDAAVDLYFVLRAPDAIAHAEWVRGDTHSHRTVDEGDLANIRLIDEYLRSEAIAYGVQTVDPQEEAVLRALIGSVAG